MYYYLPVPTVTVKLNISVCVCVWLRTSRVKHLRWSNMNQTFGAIKILSVSCLMCSF